MLKGEIYGACALLCFGFVFFMSCYAGLPWWLALTISLVPAVYFARKSAKWAEKITDK